MTIKVYTSPMGDQALEVHEHGVITLGAWFNSVIKDYKPENALFIVTVYGKAIPPTRWAEFTLTPDTEVRIYPYPRGGIGKIFNSVFKLIGSLLGVKSSVPSYTTPDTGTALDTSGTAKANQAKLGDPIRQVFGKMQVYPDYLVAPVSRFDSSDPTVFYTRMFVCLGLGSFDFASGDVRIGATPIDAFGNNASYKTYEPGADVSADENSEMWYVSNEVGSTSSGSGLDMGTTAPSTDEITADSVTVSGASVAFMGLSDAADDSDDTSNSYKFPDSWTVGAAIELAIPISATVATAGNYSRIYGNDLQEIAPYIGMPVTLTYNSISYDLYVAQFSGPDSSTGAPAWVELAYASATGTAFSGIPEGTQVLAIGHRGNEYQILTLDAPSLTVARMVDGTVDTTWPGFYNRTMLDFSAQGLNSSDLWLGPFLACPESETVDMFEVNFSFSNGLIDYTSSGDKKNCTADYEIQYRVYGGSDGWQSTKGSFTQKNPNGLGFTTRVTLDSSALVEVRVRRTNKQGQGNARDTMYWSALQSRLSGAPTSYPGVTTMSFYIVLGGQLAAQSDRKVNVVATAKYNTGTARTVSGAINQVIANAGLPNFDTNTLADLETAYWTAKGINFDFIADDDSASVNDILTTITAAARGYFTMKDGVPTVGLDIAKPWSRVVTAREMTDNMQTDVVMPSDDDADGYDVTYTSGQTWSDETVQCRIPGADTAVNVKSVNADGITDQDKAYQFGMRLLMRAQKQRLSYSYSTEMSALSYGYGDRVALSDDIPGSNMLSCFMMGCTYDSGTGLSTIETDEPLDWTLSNPRVIIGAQDGSVSDLLAVTKVNEYHFTVEGDFSFDASSAMQSPRVLFCDSTQAGYSAIISEIAPGSDGTCDVTGTEYREDINQYDETTYPGDTD